MPGPFSHHALVAHGWRQGAILGPDLTKAACELSGLAPGVFVVVSHDCDVVNPEMEKEPRIELIRGEPAANVDKQQQAGRNPRRLQVVHDQQTYVFSVHDRCFLPRAELMREAPAALLGEVDRRIVAEWLAKRYIRAAFPTSFDQRWRSSFRKWLKLLERHSELLVGVYLQLNSMAELPVEKTYVADVLMAVKPDAREQTGWAHTREALAREVENFWSPFQGIECGEVDVLGTDEITLDQLTRYLRFDADWISFADDTTTTPLIPG